MSFEILVAATFTKNQIAIALAHSPMGSGHLGIAFHSAKEGRKVTHLAWHKSLRVDDIPDNDWTCWVSTTLDLPSAASKQVVGIVRTVSKRLPQINYGTNFIAAQGSFTPRGEYRPPRGSDGLTCASFVLEVLRAAAVPLIKEGTWRCDQANIKWAEDVCAQLKKSGVSDDHVDAVRKNINGLRLRPYELAGAADMPRSERPVDFDAVQADADKAEGFLQNFCPRQVRPNAN